MKRIIFFGLFLIAKISFAQFTLDSLGLSGHYPVKVGTGVFGGPANQKIYLNELVDVKGRELKFKRIGSCCHFESANAPLGIGVIDVFFVGYFEGDKIVDSSQLYLTFYDYEKPMHPPRGFRFACGSMADSLEVNEYNVLRKYGKSKHVSLAFDHLKEIPDYIFDLQHIETLTVAYNDLDSIPEAIGQLKNLRVLELQSNHIKLLPHSFAELTQLEEIHLCNLMNWDNVFTVLAKCKKLKTIIFWDVGLDSIPIQILKCQNIEKLNLKGNSKINFERGFGVLGKLANLKELTIGFETDQIPVGLSKLKSLEILNIEHSKIKSMSNEIVKLEKLKELHFRYCREIRQLPSVISDCKNLKKVSLYSMDETFDYSKSIQFLKNLDLENLDISQAWRIKKLPDEIFNFKNLKYLGLNIYETDSLPKTIGKLTQLEEIILGPTNFKYLPVEFGNLHSLRKIDLSGRVDFDFEQVFQVFAELKNLEEINIDWGEQRLPDNIKNLKKIKKIVMSNYNRKYTTKEERLRHKTLLPDCEFIY